MVVEDDDFAGDGLLLADAFDDVAGPHVQPDRVAAVGHFVVETLDFGKGGLESVLLNEGSETGDGFLRKTEHGLPIAARIVRGPRLW